MFASLKMGFNTTKSQSFLLFVLWLYHFLWGFALMAAVKAVVVPLLLRYPGGHLPSDAAQLFMAEAQFRLMKTDMSHPYLWMLLGFAAVRMLLTPFLNAGVYFSIHHTSMNAGYRFVQGIRQLSVPFLGYYVLQMIVTLTPLWGLVRLWKHALSQHGDYLSLVIGLLPWIAAYIAYSLLVSLCFVYIQLGRATDISIGKSLSTFFRNLPLIVGLAFTILAMSFAATAAAVSVSLLWAGISALVLQQLFHLVNLTFKLWAVASQYHLFANDR